MAAQGQSEPQKRMACWQCPRYSRTERHCRDGKTNPKKKTDSMAVAEALGVRALCHYNPYRDALALRMHYPALPLPAVPKRSRRGPMPPAPDATTAQEPQKPM